jgi:hypothetical protein
VVALAKEVLKARKATEYAPLVITECSAAELPPTLVTLLIEINACLTAKTAGDAPGAGAQAGSADGGVVDAAGPGEA